MIFFSPDFCAGTTKLVDNRPPVLAKFLPNSQELGNTSSSEGEKDSPPPEWDSVPVHKPGSCKYGDLETTLPYSGQKNPTGCVALKGGLASAVCWKLLLPASQSPLFCPL